jgi:hypothetical protein
MKHITILFIVGILVSSAIGAVGTNINKESRVSLVERLTTPMIQLQSANTEGYLSLELVGTATYQATAGHPRLPMMVRTVELPFGATDISVTLIPQTITTQHITQEIRPALPLLPLTPEYQNLAAQTTYKDNAIYAMTTPYPETWYTSTVGVGLNKNNQHVTFVTIHYYPIRYTPATGTLHIADTADATITYTPPQHPLLSGSDAFDLLIIAPKAFERSLKPLIDHKNSYGVATILKTTEDIYKNYEGVDKPEQIKYAIKEAIETQGITSVLLVGGLKNLFCAKPRDDTNQGSKGWHVPVRYTNLFDNPKFPLAAEAAIFDPGVISDLYYADIYQEEIGRAHV